MKKILSYIISAVMVVALVYAVNISTVYNDVTQKPQQVESQGSADFKSKSILIIENDAIDSNIDVINNNEIQKIDFNSYSEEEYNNANEKTYLKTFFNGVNYNVKLVGTTISQFINKYIMAIIAFTDAISFF